MNSHPRGFFDLIDHTADVGLRIVAADLNALFEVAALGLMSLITSTEDIALREKRHFRLQGDDLEDLFVSWLQELLYVLDTDGFVFGRFQANVKDTLLEAAAWGEPFDPEIHSMNTEIKAVTYHQLEIGETDQGWQARVIFDL